MSFGIGDKVVFTAYSNPKFNDYGTVVDLVTHNDGSTSPVVRFNGTDELMYPMVRYLEVVDRFPRDSKPETIDEQTIMFWTLQLQFMEMSPFLMYLAFKQLELSGLYVKNKYTKRTLKLLPKVLNNTLGKNQKQCLATHLALQLSGIEE